MTSRHDLRICNSLLGRGKQIYFGLLTPYVKASETSSHTLVSIDVEAKRKENLFVPPEANVLRNKKRL
jgi:hypothetical protein